MVLCRYFRQARPVILSRWAVIQASIFAVFGSLMWFQMNQVEETIDDRRGIVSILCYNNVADSIFIKM